MHKQHFVRSVVSVRSARTPLVGLVLVALLATVLGALPTSMLSAAEAVVPTPGAGAAVITVKVGGDRVSSTSVNGLQGVTLKLAAAGTGSSGAGSSTTQGNAGTAYTYAWATCVSDADGDCSFTIPIRSGDVSSTGAPPDTRFWVVEPTGTSPAGWYSNPKFRLGGFGATPEYTWDYRFRTDSQLRAGTTYRSTTSLSAPNDWDAGAEPDRGFMRNREDTNSEGGMGSNIGRTSGIWSQSRTNPVFPAKCGLKVAIVADTSASLGATGMAQEKSAIGDLVDAFRGTPTSMSLFSFSTASPGDNATNRPDLLPVTTATQGTIFKNQYSGWGQVGGTNWGQGLAAAASSGNKYDLVVLLTDGNPTTAGTSPADGASAFNSFRDIDAGIFSANQLKAPVGTGVNAVPGARVVAVGVGSAVSSPASVYNLRAVSGTTENSDYFRAADFAEAAGILSDLAKATCQGSIQVQKMIVPTGGTIAEATPAPAGWEFAASTSAAGVSIADPTTTSTTVGDDGVVNFGLAFSDGATSGNVSVLEAQKSGYQLVPVGAGASARNAVCTTATGTAVSVTDAGTATNPGFAVDGQSGTQVVCKIYNTKLPTQGNLVVKKSSDPVSGTALNPGDSATYTLTFQNAGELPVAVNHDDVLTDVLDDADVSNIQASDAALTTSGPSGGRLSVTGSVPAGKTYVVTYTVTVPDPVKAGGNGVLNNYLVPDGVTPPTACVESTNLCTTHPIPGKLVVAKSSDPASGTAVLRGDSINYTLTFSNIGGKPMTVNHTDVLTKLLDDATITAGPTATGALTVTPSPLGSATSFDIDGTLAGGTTATVTYTAKVKTTGLGDGVLDNFLIKDGDAPPTACVPKPGQGPTCTTHPVPSNLVVTKTSDPISTTPVVAGQVLTYTLTFANGGGSTAAADHTDSLAKVLDDADLVNGSLTASDGLTATLAGDGQSFRVTGSVQGGGSLVVTYKVTVKSDGFGDGQLDNFVRKTGTNPPTTCQPVDALCTTHPVPPKLTVIKDSTPADGTVVPLGSLVSYTLTFSNAGGSAAPVDYTDDLSKALDDAAVEGQPAISGTAHGLSVSAVSGGRFAVTGNLVAGKTVQVTYTLRVNTTGLGDGVLTNVVVKTGTTPPTTCATGDPLCTEHPVAGKLAVAKTSNPATGTEVKPGDKVKYTLTFKNIGGMSMPVDYTDYLAKVLDDADLTAPPTASDSVALQVAMADDELSFKVSGKVAKESVVTVTYEVTVKTEDFGDGDLLNFLRPGTTAPPATCKSTDPLCTEHPVPGILDVAKSSDPESGTEIKADQEITYRLTFANSGGQASPVDHTDYLSKVLDDATMTSAPKIVGAANGLSVSAINSGAFAVTGNLAASKTVLVEYKVKVKAADRGDSVLDNYLMKGDETPPTTCVTAETDCTTHPVGAYNVSKSVDPASTSAVVPGQVLTYRVTFANTGATDQAIDHSDLLGGVLDDAKLTKDPSFVGGDAFGLVVTPDPYTGSRIDIDGTLTAGKTAIVTYQVTVKLDAADRGDGVLSNFVIKGDGVPLTECLPGDRLCTENPTSDFSVTKSSDPVSGTVVATGDEITYTLTFNNAGGAPVDVDYTDHLAKVLDDAELVSPPAFAGVGGGLSVGAVADQKFTVSGSLAARAVAKVTYKVKVKPIADRGDSVLDNFLVKGNETPPTTCTPQTPLCTEHPVGELAVSKSVNPASFSVVTEGQELTYRLTFANLGAADAEVYHTDHLARVLDDARITSDPKIVGEVANLKVSPVADKKFTVSGVLAKGTTAVVEYKVEVLPTADRGDSQLDNFLVKGAETPPSKCEEGDPLCTENPVGDFSVTKTSDPESGTRVKDGDTVKYTLEFKNMGAASHPVDYTDYLANVLDDAILTKAPAIVGAAHGLSVSAVANKEFTVSGDLEARKSVKVSYQVKVHETGNGDNALTNFLVEGNAKPPTECTSGTALCTRHPVLVPEVKGQWLDGMLPNTGGPAFMLLVAGLLALLAGLIVVGMGRRREE